MDTPNFYDASTLPPVKSAKADKSMVSRLSLAELQNTAEYQRLTEKQKLFVTTYCEGGLVDGRYDAVAAVTTAYACKKPYTALKMSYAMMSNIRIIAVLNRHFNTTPTEDFMKVLDRAIQNKHLTIAQVEALRLKCLMLGYKLRVKPLVPAAVPPEVAEAEKEVRKATRKHDRLPKVEHIDF